MTEATPGADRPAVRRDLLLLAVSCAAFFLVRLGARDLWNPNEPIYGEAVREMAELKTWLVPHVNGIVFGEKPILYYWLALVSAKLLGGVSETSLRLPSVAGGIVTVLGAYLLVLPYAGRRRALATAILLATTYEIWWLSRAVAMDILLTGATLWVVIGVTRVLDFELAPWKGWSLAGVAAGLGFIAKGPIGWICPGLAVLTYAIATRRLKVLLRAEMALGAAICLVVALPWYLILGTTGHTDVLHEVLIRQNFQRFTDPWDHVAPFWYYVPYYFSDMAPWSLFTVLAWRLPGRTERDRKLAILSLCWIVAVVVFFSMSKSKRDPYIVPVAPAAAALAAEVLVGFAEGRLPRARRAGVIAIVALFAFLFAACGAALWVKLAPSYPDTAGAARALGVITIASALALAWVLLRRREGAAVPLAMAGSTLAFFLSAAAFVLPAANAYKSARPLCEAASLLVRPGDRISSYNFWRWRAEFRYYLGRPIENLPGPEPLRSAWDGPSRVVLFVEGDQLTGAREVIGDRKPELTRGVGSMTTYVFVNR